MRNNFKISCFIAIVAIIGQGFTTCDNSGGGVNGDNTVPVTGVTLNKTALALTVGGSDTLVADISPSNATNTNVTWVSSNTSVATVTNGTVTAVAAGTATITVTTADGGKTATCTVTVVAVGVTIPVTGVTLNKTALALTVGGSDTLLVDISPSNATNTNVTWVSSNPSVAIVNNGTVTAVAAGTATITITTADGGKTATCAVTVTEDSTPVTVTGITLNKTTLALYVGSHETLLQTVIPENATNKAVTWSSSNSSVAMVVDGVVYAVAEGTATILVSTADGGKIATCAVMVATGAVTGVTLDKTTLILTVGEHETLHQTVAPENAINKAVTWSTSNASVAMVEDGLVTAITEGIATITVTTTDGSKTAACEVTVHTHIYIWKVASTTYPAQSIQTCSICDNTTGTARNTARGDTGPAGGIIFYENSLGFTVTGSDYFTAYYLEASPVDLPFAEEWSLSGPKTINTGTAIGTGKENTRLILATGGDTPAAKACVEYSNNGKTDWFLPSKDELNEMYKGRSYLGISSEWYWSSSQGTVWYNAWLQDFKSGRALDVKQDSSCIIRAVRAF